MSSSHSDLLQGSDSAVPLDRSNAAVKPSRKRARDQPTASPSRRPLVPVDAMLFRSLRRECHEWLMDASEEQCKDILLHLNIVQVPLPNVIQTMEAHARDRLRSMAKRPLSRANRQLLMSIIRLFRVLHPNMVSDSKRARKQNPGTGSACPFDVESWTWLWQMVLPFLELGELLRGVGCASRSMHRRATSLGIFRMQSHLDMRRLPESVVFSQQHLLLTLLPSLKSMRCNRPYTGNSTLRLLSQTCPTSLLHLDLTNCVWISDGGIESLTRSCTNLRSINLSSCNPGISDRSMLMLTSNCRSLDTLVARHCLRITDISFMYIGASESMRRGLINIDITGCPQISDTSLLALQRYWANHPDVALRKLCVNGCFNITDRGVAALSCLPLNQVGLALCCSITDAGLMTALQPGKALTASLTDLDIRQCPHVSTVALELLFWPRATSIPAASSRVNVLQHSGNRDNRISNGFNASGVRVHVRHSCTWQQSLSPTKALVFRLLGSRVGMRLGLVVATAMTARAFGIPSAPAETWLSSLKNLIRNLWENHSTR